MTAKLIYGSGAEERALAYARSISKQDYSCGAQKLSTDEAKNATQKMVFAPIGSDKFCVVVGAVDNARANATDALLKSIEEHPEFVVPILWASGLDGVPPTVRSRCESVWVGEDDLGLDPKCVRLVNACLSSDYQEVISVSAEMISESGTHALLRGVGDALSEKDFSEPRVALLWGRVRSALQQHYTLSKTEALGVLCI